MDQGAISADERVDGVSSEGGPASPHRTGERRRLLQSIFFQPDREFTQEQGQALARVLITGLATLVLYAVAQFTQDATPSRLGMIYLIASMLYLLYVSRHQHVCQWRRYVVMVLDLGVASYLTAYISASGIAVYPVFLWVIVGNGLRFGQHFMQLAMLLGLLGFSGAMAYSGLLWSQPANYIGLMAGLVLMPKFFMVMIDRLAAANVELKEQKDHAEFMATHDLLTGLPNRAYLHARMDEVLASAQRNGNKVAVAFIDLDSFKSINDSFGHEYGDFLLSQVADAMKAVLRASDTVARLGGDEFVVVIEDSADGARIGRVIERLFSCVGRYYSIGEYETYVSWSCGVVVYPHDGGDIHTLLKHADTAMYAAKFQGPNNYAFYDAVMSEHVSQQLAVRDDLRLALERQEFEVYYQPIVDAQSGRTLSAEALLRWNHPQKGMLSPATFIEIAEQTGLINAIGCWVLREALHTAGCWQALVDYPVKIHVNVSAHQLKHEAFLDEVRSLLGESGLPPDLLELEITESILLEDAQRAEELLASLREFGIKLALDDFGTGFSSLSYLKSLPVDAIKIDKSFIDDLPAGEREAALVDAIITIGARLGNAIIAEGVETAQQRDWLVAHGCGFLQGYYFSRPVPQVRFLEIAGTCYEVAQKVARAR